ncbi:MAG: hypothetical protein Q7S55_04425 [Nanoarchaeota archaeon]|nr:hypothetical protein [Nanoarchaeota archaeon]
MVDTYLLAYVQRAKNRLQILKLLETKEKTQAQLHKESGMYRTHVRRTLLELEGKGLVKCLNPKDRLYKIYKITGQGKVILAK